MSKISFAIQGKKVFVFNEALEKRYHTFTLFVLSWAVKALFILFGLLALLSFLGIGAITSSVLIYPAILIAIFGLIRLVILGIKYKLRKPSLSEILLLVSLVVFGISKIVSKGINYSTEGIFGVVSFVSLLSIILSLVFFLREYSSKAMKALLLIGYSLITLKVFLDMFYVIQSIVVALQSSSKQVGSVSGLTFEVYIVAIGLYYILLKMKMKIYYKILSYVLLISSLFLLSYSMKTVGSYWVVALTSLVLLAIEIVLNYKKIWNFFKASLKSFKDKKYISFGINVAIVLIVIALSVGGIYLLFSKLNINYLTSEFTSFWQNFKGGNTLLRVFGSDQNVGSASSNSLMTHIGLNFGILPLISLLVLVGFMVFKVVKTLPKHTELYLYFILFGLLHSIFMPISLLPLLVMAFVYLALSESEKKLEKTNRAEHKDRKVEKVMNDHKVQKNNSVNENRKKNK